MPTAQENYRIENASSAISSVGRMSDNFVNQILTFLSAYQRDKEIINARLTDSNLTDDDYLHNGAKSPTIGEFKGGLRAVLSYAVHGGVDLSQSQAESMMADAGISDNTILPPDQIADALEPLRL